MKKTIFLKNSLTALFLEITVFIFGFFVPRFIIRIYGPEIHGLSTNIIQIITLIQLIQAGSIDASKYAMFKPINDSNLEMVAKIYNSSKDFYNKSTFIFLIISTIIAFLSPYLISSNTLNDLELIISFFIFIFVGFFHMFYVSRFDTILSAHQKRYILTLSNLIERLIYYIFLFVVILLEPYFIYLYFPMVVGMVTKVYFLNKNVNKYFNEILTFEIDSSERIRIPNKNNVMITSVILNFINSAPYIFVSINFGLEYVSIYSVYAMVSVVILMLLNLIYYSSIEILGTTVAKNNQNEISISFDNFNFMYFVVVLLICIPAYFLITPFINLYIGENPVNYIYPLLGKTIIIYLIFYMLFLSLRSILNSYGLFKIQRNAVIISSIITVFFYVFILDKKFDLISIASILFYFIFLINVLIMIIKKNLDLIKLMLKPISYFLLSTIIIFVGELTISNIFINSISLISWLLSGVIMTIALSTFLICYVLIFERSKLKTFINFIKIKTKIFK